MQLDLKLANGTQDDETSDNYYTPPWIFDALGLRYDLDVASPSIVLPWIPAAKRFTILDDGLQQDWGGGKVWMNPPYSNPKPWVAKFLNNDNGVALMPTSTGAWMLTLWQSQAKWLCLPPMRFVQSNLIEAKGAMPIRCWLVAAGKDNIRALKSSGLGHVR